MTGVPLVTVVVPARNESGDIEDCLGAVLAQSWPSDRLEILVVDGDSDDDTARRAREALARHSGPSAVLSNPEATTPTSLNMGLGAATGEYVCRVDARSFVPPDYVRVCVETLASRPDVAVVGGSQRSVARPEAGMGERVIARALRNPYTTGLAAYRRATASGPADTVYLGAFRTEELRAAGGWNVRFRTNQDFELNQRMRALGAVWFDRDLSVLYRPRSSLAALYRQYRRFGRWKAAVWLETDLRPRPRQLALLVLPVAAIAVAVAMRRRRMPFFAGSALVAAALDRASGEGGSVLERCLAIAVGGAIGFAWWAGVVEQTCRFARGERLLSSNAG